MTQSSCKRDTKSKSHSSVKLAPVRVFSCEHPLSDGDTSTNFQLLQIGEVKRRQYFWQMANNKKQTYASRETMKITL